MVVSSVVTVSSGLAQQIPKPAQPPKIDMNKTSRAKEAEKTLPNSKNQVIARSVPKNESY